MTDERASARSADEIDHGVVPDPLAWKLPLTDKTIELSPFQTFRAEPHAEGSGATAVARSEQLGMYVRSFADGAGEDGLHAHLTDAISMVLEGSATFHGPGARHLGDLEAHEGILVPGGVSYRFVCSGPTVMARISVGQIDRRGSTAE